MREGVIGFSRDHRVVAAGGLFITAQCKLNLTTNGIEIRDVFTWSGERVQRFLEPSGRAQRQGCLDLIADREFRNGGHIRRLLTPVWRTRYATPAHRPDGCV